MTGQQIRTIRKRLGLSQVKFATTIGVSFQSVNRWENGKNKPSDMAMRGIRNLSAGRQTRPRRPKPFRHECACGRVVWFIQSPERPR